MPTIQQQIESIISNRRQYQPEFKNAFGRVLTIEEFINSVKAFQSNKGWLQILDNNERLKNEWESLIQGVSELEELARSLHDGDNGLLIECLKRVNRDYLNIGCVGPWRQGKSTVIAKLTNLSDYVIPRSKFLTCTGTTINVFNGNQVVWENGQYVEKDGDKAVVYYHTFNSICNTINDYLRDLGLDPMPYASTKETFVANCHDCYQRNLNNPGNNSKLKEMLDNYLSHAVEYADLLKSDGERDYDEIKNLSSVTSQQELRPLVSYYEFTDEEYKAKGIENPPQKYKVLAVKKVDVYTHFMINGGNGPEEVGKIQFVDTPGLGESKLEVESILSHALRSELDIAICLRKVSNQAGITPNDSLDFHKVLKQNTHGRKPEKWVFYLYNKEGAVASDILSTTFSKLNEDLKKKEQGLYHNQVVDGINLTYNESEIDGNHIAFIDTLNESDKLQEFFMSILVEMASTIKEADAAFYTAAREKYTRLINQYANLINNQVRNITKCLPTFDDRQNILITINAIYEKWRHTVKCPETLSETINQALSTFYNEPYGAVLAEVLGVPKEEIGAMCQSIRKIDSASEMLVREKISRRKQIAKDVIFPRIQTEITQNEVNVHGVNADFIDWSDKLSDLMVNRALSYIRTANIIQQMESVKIMIWRGMMNDGKLAFNSNDEKKWIIIFLKLLEEGGADFANLHDIIQDFHDYKFDLEGEISKIIKSTIAKVVLRFTILVGEDGSSIEKIHDALFETLLACESETKAAIQAQCANVVGSQLAIALSNFNEKINQFQMTVIPKKKNPLTYNIEFEQLIKFYNKYSSEIFSNDMQAAQKLAVQEWNVVKMKYIV